jgi:hypothetical protein
VSLFVSRDLDAAFDTVYRQINSCQFYSRPFPYSLHNAEGVSRSYLGDRHQKFRYMAAYRQTTHSTAAHRKVLFWAPSTKSCTLRTLVTSSTVTQYSHDSMPITCDCTVYTSCYADNINDVQEQYFRHVLLTSRGDVHLAVFRRIRTKPRSL